MPDPTRLHEKIDLILSAAMAASSVMLFFGTGLHPLWWLTWLAPLPLLLVSPRLGAWPCFRTAALVWFLGSLNMWHYLLVSIHVPITLVVILSAVPAGILGLAVVQFRKFVQRGALWKASFVVPTLWVTFEYLTSVASPHSTFGNLGYTQADCVPILQVASVVGIWGISFCLFLLPATGAALLGSQVSPTARKRLAAVVGAVLASAIVYGSWRLIFTPGAQQSLSVGLVAAGAENPIFQGHKTASEQIHDYTGQIARLAAKGAQVIVLPEKIAFVAEEKTGRFDALFEAAATAARVNVVVGLDRGSETRRSNEARMYSPDGTITAIYDKHHLVSRFEDVDRPGTKRTVVNEPCGVWGFEICKDMDFPRLSRQYGAERVALLVVPAWDFVVDGWLHDRMAAMRGVENGFTIVRSASEGRLTVSDDRGRVLAEQNSEKAPFSSLVAPAPVRHDDTLYSRWGDWFVWANVAGLLVILLTRARSKSFENECAVTPNS